MSDFWWRPLTTLALLFLFALPVWGLFGLAASLAALCGALLMLLLFHLRQLRQLDAWLEHAEPNAVPHGSGLWEQTFSALYHLTRLHSRNQHRLSAALERFQDAAKAMPDGIVVLNEMDRIEWCNAMAEAQFGLDNGRDRGQHISYLLRQPQFADYLNARDYCEPLLLRPARNRDATLSIQLVPYGDRQKLLISRDITQMERVEAVRRDFVANVSHEMRTPLTVVGGFLETLLHMERWDVGQTRQHLRLMLDQTHRMQRLVEDLLTLSKLESAQEGVKEDRINVPQLINTLADETRTLSAGRHEIRVELAAELGVLGSEHELRSAFSNLLSNAVRYTPEGGEITLRWEKRGDEAVFSVRDTGEGIDSHHIPRLTERFYRVDRSRSRETGGTGLGLAIVKHVLSRHQARLEIASTPGKGSTFGVCFPTRRVVEQND